MDSAREPSPVRLGIVLDVEDANADLVLMWAGRWAARLVEELQSHGVLADVVGIDVDGHRRFSW